MYFFFVAHLFIDNLIALCVVSGARTDQSRTFTAMISSPMRSRWAVRARS